MGQEAVVLGGPQHWHSSSHRTKPLLQVGWGFPDMGGRWGCLAMQDTQNSPSRVLLPCNRTA